MKIVLKKYGNVIAYVINTCNFGIVNLSELTPYLILLGLTHLASKVSNYYSNPNSNVYL